MRSKNEGTATRPDKCEFCDGFVKPAIKRAPFHYKGRTVYVDNLPVRSCSKCGEIYFEAKVYKLLEKIAANTGRIQTKVSFPLADYLLATTGKRN